MPHLEGAAGNFCGEAYQNFEMAHLSLETSLKKDIFRRMEDCQGSFEALGIGALEPEKSFTDQTLALNTSTCGPRPNSGKSHAQPSKI